MGSMPPAALDLEVARALVEHPLCLALDDVAHGSLGWVRGRGDSTRTVFSALRRFFVKSNGWRSVASRPSNPFVTKLAAGPILGNQRRQWMSLKSRSRERARQPDLDSQGACRGFSPGGPPESLGTPISDCGVRQGAVIPSAWTIPRAGSALKS